MLQEFREQHLIWDKANRRIHESVKANTSDSKGRKLTVQVLNDGVVEDLAGTSLSLFWKTRNEKNKGLDAFDVVDASQGIFELYYTTGMLSNEGKLRANLVLVDDLGKIVSDAFVIEVSPGIDEEAVESSDSFTALTKALVDVQNLEQNYAPRLNEVTAQLAQTESVLNERVSQTIATAGDGTLPSELTDMRVKADGTSSTVAGDALRETQEGYAVLKNAITADHINPSDVTHNVLDPSNLVKNQYMYGNVGEQATQRYTSTYSGILEPIPVKTGDIVRFNRAEWETYFVGVDENDNVLQRGVNVRNPDKTTVIEVIAEEGVTGFYTSVNNASINEAMITINKPMPTQYLPHILEKELKWLKLRDKSIKLNHLDDDVKGILSEAPATKYKGTNGVITGDSIIWNSGRSPQGETLIGYDGVLKRDLGLNSVGNFGYDGYTMATRSNGSNGVYDRLITEQINWLDTKFLACNAGTNDFANDIPIGELEPFGSDFNTKTYIGSYQALIEYLIGQNPDIEIVIMAPAQRDRTGNTSETTNGAGHKLIDYVNAGKRVAQKYSSTFVDIYSESGISQLNVWEYTYDGLHLTNKGYEKAGNLVVKKMLYS